MSGGYGAHQQAPFGELGHEVGQGQWQRSTVGHDVGDARRGREVVDRRRQDTYLAVEAADDDRHLLQVRGQVGVLLFGRTSVDLQARVADLHDVARSWLGPRVALEVPVHDVPSACAQTEVDRGCVHHDPIAHSDGPGELGEGVGATDVGVDPLQAGALRQKCR